MKIVVECSCQVPYEFEIEPVDGQMPGSVFCPTCGADGTEYANWVIQQTLAAEQPASHKIGLKGADSTGQSSSAESGDATGDEASSLPKFCYVHKDQPVEAFCLTCKKPICLKCMRQSGYFCSPYCLSRAEQAGMDIPKYKGQEKLVRVREYQSAVRLIMGLVLGVIALFAAYEWYTIFGQKPSVKFSMPVTGGEERLQRTQFLSDHELLLADSEKISAYDFKKNQQLWSKSLAGLRPAPPPRTTLPADDDDSSAKPAKLDKAEIQRKQAEQMAAYQDYYDAAEAKLRIVGHDLWVTVGRNIICLDLGTGAEKAKTQVEGRIQEMGFGDKAMVVVSLKGTYDYVFTQIELPAGTQKVERRTVPAPPPRPNHPFDYQMNQGELDDMLVIHEDHRFAAAGATVAGLAVKLVEKKVVSVDTMKAADPKAFAEGVKVTQVKEFAEDVFNEMSRIRGGGTARIDDSRYAVTIQRVFGKDVAPWTGEVTGPPALFALPSVDVLIAGKTVYVFGRNNQKLWESTLTYPISPQFQPRESWWGARDLDPRAAPCIERGDTLYLFDQGVLTAFDIKSGTARWRMPSVGVSKIQFDDKGMLYVTTTSANPESIQYSQQVNLDKVNPIILKVDPANGKILWRVEKVGDACYLAGKYIYVTMNRSGGGGLVSLVSGTPSSSNFRLFRLNPKNGKQLWEFYRSPGPAHVDFHDNEILFQFPDKLQVLKFLSL